MKYARFLWALAIVQPAFSQTGWQMSNLTSPMGDDSGIILSAKQKEIPQQGNNAPSGQTGLSIQCSKKKGLEIVLSTGSVLNQSGSVGDKYHKGLIGGLASKHGNATLSPIRIRFDQQKAQGGEWMLGANPGNLFAQKPKKFLDELLKGNVQEVVFEARPYLDNPIYLKFDVSGLDQYRTALHDNCSF
jgi:hypothetical protein